METLLAVRFVCVHSCSESSVVVGSPSSSPPPTNQPTYLWWNGVLSQRLDVDNSGTVDRDEFLKACKQDGKVLECFGRIFGVQGVSRSCFLCAVPNYRALAATRSTTHVWALQSRRLLECATQGTKSPTKMRQVRRKFGMIKRLLNAHPSEGLSTKEQISLGQYSSMPKVLSC